MNKIVRIIIWSLLFLITLSCGIYGMNLSKDTREVNNKLKSITEYFNNSMLISNYSFYDTSIVATANNDKIIIKYINANTDNTYEFTYISGILTGTINIGDTYAKEVLKILVSAIAENLGQNYANISVNFDNLDLATYTIDKGLTYEINNSSAIVRINTNTPLIIETVYDQYFTENDLISDRETILNGNYTKSKNNLILTKSGSDIHIVSILEKEGLTENSYNSIISILSVLYESEDITSYFKNNYSYWNNGNKTFNGFVIEVNPIMNETEKLAFGDDNTLPFVRITIDKSKIELTSSTDSSSMLP